MSAQAETEAILQKTDQYLDQAVQFFRDIIAIPSYSAREEQVAHRIRAEMQRLGFDKAWFDDYGNVIGQIGTGAHPRLVFDGHIDTVEVTDPDRWDFDPFRGKVENGVVFGRGASDNKAAPVVQIYGVRVLRDVMGERFPGTVFVLGSVQEEDCDGLGHRFAVMESIGDVDGVVLGECTNCAIYRGHRGRMELIVTVRGVSCHASAPERGDNAVYKASRVILEIEKLNDNLADHPFLGKGTIAVAKTEVKTDSLNCVPYECKIFIDRRLTWGETKQSAVQEIEQAARRAGVPVEIEIPVYDRPSWRGKVLEVEKYFPTWMLEEEHPMVESAAAAFRNLFGKPPVIDKWTFSTNGVFTAGLHGVPTIGFGPSEERFAHTMIDQCPIEHLRRGIAFYAAFPLFFSRKDA
ncbi:MAG: YgeY family selenium metabolism-linked hydrolase [Candidatus Sumerlaeia bacterium]